MIEELWQEIQSACQTKRWWYAHECFEHWVALAQQHSAVADFVHLHFREINELRRRTQYEVELVQATFPTTQDGEEKKERTDFVIGLVDGAEEFQRFFDALLNHLPEGGDKKYLDFSVQKKPAKIQVDPCFIPDLLIFGDSGYQHQLYLNTAKHAHTLPSIYISGEPDLNWDRALLANTIFSTLDLTSPKTIEHQRQHLKHVDRKRNLLAEFEEILQSNRRFVHVPFGLVSLFERTPEQNLAGLVESKLQHLQLQPIDLQLLTMRGEQKEKIKFCAYFYMNSVPERQQFCVELEKAYKKVDILGTDLHRDPGSVGHDRFQPQSHDSSSLFDRTTRTYKCFKFVICFENGSHPGYITEKIINAKLAGAIPIVWGAPDLLDYISRDSIVYLKDLSGSQIQAAIQEIKTLDEDEKLWAAKAKAPLLSSFKMTEAFEKAKSVLKHMIDLHHELVLSHTKFVAIGSFPNVGSFPKNSPPKPFRCICCVMGLENSTQVAKLAVSWQSIARKQNRYEIQWIGTCASTAVATSVGRSRMWSSILLSPKYENRIEAILAFEEWISSVPLNGDEVVLFTEPDVVFLENFLPLLDTWCRLQQDSKKYHHQKILGVQLLPCFKMVNLPCVALDRDTFLLLIRKLKDCVQQHPELALQSIVNKDEKNEKKIEIVMSNKTLPSNFIYTILYQIIHSESKDFHVVDWSTMMLGCTVANQLGLGTSLSREAFERQFPLIKKKDSKLAWIHGIYNDTTLKWCMDFAFSCDWTVSYRNMEKRNEKNPNLLIATLFYDIRSFENNDNRENKLADDYLSLGENVLAWPVNMFIMTEPKFVAKIRTIRAAHGLDHCTMICPLPIEKSCLFSLYQHNRDELCKKQKRIPKKFNPIKDTPLYAWCMWQKYECLAAALEYQPQFWPHVSSLFFVDFGIYHIAQPKNSSDLDQLLKQWSRIPRIQITSLFPSVVSKEFSTEQRQVFIKSCFIEQQIQQQRKQGLGKDEDMPLLPYCQSDIADLNVWYSRLRQATGGGVVGGPLCYMRWLVRQMLNAVEHAVLVLGWGPMDESLLMPIALNNPHMFIMIQADHCEMCESVSLQDWQSLAQISAVKRQWSFCVDFQHMSIQD